MVTTLSSESAHWALPSNPSTLPHYEESLPFRVNREGAQNYLKGRGTLNIGNWAIEGKRVQTPRNTQPIIAGQNVMEALPPKVIGPDAIRNYIRSRSSAPGLLGGNPGAPDPHHNFRVKREGRANYERNQNSQMKTLFQSYGKLPLPPQQMPHTQGELATELFYANQKGHLGSILSNYGHAPLSPKRMAHVKGEAAEMNLQRNRGHAHILEHLNERPPPSPEPHLQGVEAHLNYDMSRGSRVNKLFHEYGKLPLSARTEPKVTYGGIDNYIKGRGDNMRKVLSQCPPSFRYIERPQSVPLWH